ncbi:MAG: dephospho-CoA kinase [Alphaproteobacteria bacterium]
MKKQIVIGLTGTIGMGKSTAAKILRGFGFPVYDADKSVHQLLRKGGRAVQSVGTLFPEALKRGAIDRTIVARSVFHDAVRLKKLEQILHPLVRDIENNFLKKNKRHRAVILEIPLLFETGAEKRCDFTICVTAPRDVQMRRVLQRKGMTATKLRAILKRQMSDRQKRKKADYIVDTGTNLKNTKAHLKALLIDQGLM